MQIRFGGDRVWEAYDPILLHDAIFTDKYYDRWIDIGPVLRFKVGRYQLTIRKCLDRGMSVEHCDMEDGKEGYRSWSSLVGDNESHEYMNIWPEDPEGSAWRVRYVVAHALAWQAVEYFAQSGGLRDPSLPWGVFAAPESPLRMLTPDEIRSVPAGDPTRTS